jgi:hypothetical protein
VLPQDSAKFLKQHWEQAPVVFKASAERRALFAGLFNYVELQRLAVICEQEGEPLEFEVDVNAARYVDGKRETPNGEVSGRQWVAAGGRAGRQEAVRGGLILACLSMPAPAAQQRWAAGVVHKSQVPHNQPPVSSCVPLQLADAAAIERLYRQEGCTMQVGGSTP